jgi:hypothetical protein
MTWRLFEEEAGEEDDNIDEEEKEEDSSEEDGDEEEIQIGQGLHMDIIMAAIPRHYRHRVKAILLYTMKDPRYIIGWNDRGELDYHDKTIQGSHIIDLIKDSQYAYKNLVPLGIEEFYKGLREMNIPQSLINNDQRRDINIRPLGIPV